MNVEELERARDMLNDQQKKAVQTIEGPVMVVAGAGTGKTQLLSLRVAEILERTDTKPEQILCVTFTENGARNLRARLVDFIGNIAYQLNISTFHQLAVDILSDYSYYFSKTLHYKPADPLIQLQVIDQQLSKLPTDNPLHTKTPQGEWVYQRALLHFISDMKKRGITPDKAMSIHRENLSWFTAHAEDFIDLAEHIKGKRSVDIPSLVPKISTFIDVKHVFDAQLYTPIALYYQQVFAELAKVTDNKTFLSELRAILKPVVVKEKEGFNLKPLKSFGKQKEAIEIYAKYQQDLHFKGYYDFDDLLLTVIQQAHNDPGLQHELYEKYLYIMVDEYQDTSGVQMQFLNLFIDSAMWNRKPNVLVVGDDDQAIFAFQGATLDNIMSFKDDYPDAEIIPLIHNYRSRQAILDFACTMIEQANDRIIDRIPHINKHLISHYL